jgi:dolichol-phosphate mannosyltransferase
MNKKINSLSIILPTLNEKENLEILIPSIRDKLHMLEIENYEILVVDDGSQDGTQEYVEQIFLDSDKVRLLSRTSEKSLPKSIYYGIKSSKSEFVMWLDADGSMDAEAMEKLIFAISKKQEAIIVGSRFIEGGGYKGQNAEKKLSLKNYLMKISNSEDSIVAILLSKYFNKLIGSILNIGIKDLTSGFIIGKRKYFMTEEIFSRSVYGEYFIYLMKFLKNNNNLIVEVPYVCKPRLSGYSKTSTNYFSLLKLAVPYIRAALIK